MSVALTERRAALVDRERAAVRNIVREMQRSAAEGDEPALSRCLASLDRLNKRNQGFAPSLRSLSADNAAAVSPGNSWADAFPPPTSHRPQHSHAVYAPRINGSSRRPSDMSPPRSVLILQGTGSSTSLNSSLRSDPLTVRFASHADRTPLASDSDPPTTLPRRPKPSLKKRNLRQPRPPSPDSPAKVEEYLVTPHEKVSRRVLAARARSFQMQQHLCDLQTQLEAHLDEQRRHTEELMTKKRARAKRRSTH
jgi:hypothetical protein